jgi:hypothetical protein
MYFSLTIYIHTHTYQAHPHPHTHTHTHTHTPRARLHTHLHQTIHHTHSLSLSISISFSLPSPSLLTCTHVLDRDVVVLSVYISYTVLYSSSIHPLLNFEDNVKLLSILYSFSMHPIRLSIYLSIHPLFIFYSGGSGRSRSKRGSNSTTLRPLLSLYCSLLSSTVLYCPLLSSTVLAPVLPLLFLYCPTVPRLSFSCLLHRLSVLSPVTIRVPSTVHSTSLTDPYCPHVLSPVLSPRLITVPAFVSHSTIPSTVPRVITLLSLSLSCAVLYCRFTVT